MTDVTVLTDRYQRALKRRETVQARSQKIQTAREVAASKIKDQESKIRSLGVDPEKVDEWLAQEEIRISSSLAATEKDLDDAERVLSEIENGLKALNG